MRRAQFESRKKQARLKRISKLKQAVAFDNLGFSSSTLNHSSNSTSVVHSSGKSSHTGNLVLPTANSTSRSTLGSNGTAPQNNMTGHGSIWPMEEDEPRRPMVNRPTHYYTQDMSNGLVPNRTSKPVKVYYANGVSVYAVESREKPQVKYYEMPSSSSYEVAPASSYEVPSASSSSQFTYRNSLPDALGPTLVGSEEEHQHGQATSLSDVPLALVHRREPGKSWQKNGRIASRGECQMENNGQHQKKTFDRDQLLSISKNTNQQSRKTKNRMPTAKRVHDTISAGGNFPMTSNDRMPRESAI